MLKESCHFLEYSPMIPTILSLMLLFITEAEAFCCIKSMIDISRNYIKEGKEKFFELEEMRWYFMLEPKHFLQLCNIFFEGIQANDNDFKIILKKISHKLTMNI